MNYLAISPLVLSCLIAPACIANDNTSPDQHPEAYARFVTELDKILDNQSIDYYEAMKEVYLATQNELAGLEWMQKAASQNHPVAQHYVADAAMMSSFLEPESKVKAKGWYEMNQKAAQAGYIPAIITQSLHLNAGVGVEQDKAKAISNLLIACKDGDFLARCKWLQLTNRLSQEEDLQREEVQSEINRQNPYVTYLAGQLSSEPEKQLQYYKTAATLKNRDALFTLAQVVANTNPADSYVLMKEAVALHHPNAMTILGTMQQTKACAGSLAEKAGVEYKPTEGLLLLKMASMLDSPNANQILGQLYYKGNESVESDKERAYQHFRKACYLGELRASLSFIYLLLEGEGGEANPKLALSLCLQLSKAGVPQSVLFLAYATYKGKGMTADTHKAIEYLQEAAAFNMPQAYVYLAFIYHKGAPDLPADPKQAEAYIRMASLDLKEDAQKMFNQMVKDGDWLMKP